MLTIPIEVSVYCFQLNKAPRRRKQAALAQSGLPLFRAILSIATLLSIFIPIAQGQALDARLFFASQGACTLSLQSNFKALAQYPQADVRLPAKAWLTDSLQGSFEGNIQIGPRGKSRKEFCDPPPIMLYCKKSGALAQLGKVKMVWNCQPGPPHDQLVAKEYLAYRLYNILTNYSLQARLVQVRYREAGKNSKWQSSTGILLEDIDDAAKRVGTKELNDTTLPAAALSPQDYGLMTMFQYMIGNTDWSIKGLQNIKLLQPKQKHLPPIPVPYDFDNCGLVSAYYAAPPASVPIEQVWQRHYKGIKMSQEDVQPITELFLEKKDKLLQIVQTCTDLPPKERQIISAYLIDFFTILENPELVKSIFTKPLQN